MRPTNNSRAIVYVYTRAGKQYERVFKNSALEVVMLQAYYDIDKGYATPVEIIQSKKTWNREQIERYFKQQKWT